jgi:hypothetical protein
MPAHRSTPRTDANDRAHDLVDLQILEQKEDIDRAELAMIATRLFKVRNAQPWPPVVVAHPGWQTIYNEAADGLDVREDFEHAVEWANGFIRSLTVD